MRVNYEILQEEYMELLNKHCVPCEGGTSLNEDEENELIRQLSGWELDRRLEHKIVKSYSFDSYRDTITFVNKIADLAETEGHHPDLYIGYGRVRVELYTHAMLGLSKNDFILAVKIDTINY